MRKQEGEKEEAVVLLPSTILGGSNAAAAAPSPAPAYIFAPPMAMAVSVSATKGAMLWNNSILR